MADVIGALGIPGNAQYSTGARKAQDLITRKLGGQPVGAPPPSQTDLGQAAAAAQGQAVQQKVEQLGQKFATAKAQTANDQGQALLGAQKAQRTTQGQLLQQQRGAEDLLSSLDSVTQEQLVQNELKFQQDAMGRAKFTENQLLDWAVTSAKDEEDLKNKMQVMQQTAERAMAADKMAFEKMDQELRADAGRKQKKLTQEKRLELEQASAMYKQQYRDKAAKAASKAAITRGILTVGGAVAGGVIGSVIPGAGTTAGAITGGALGGGAADIGTAKGWF
jgi:hypothetical protein